MSRASSEVDDEHDGGSEELVLEGQTVVNGPNLLPDVSEKEDEEETEN